MIFDLYRIYQRGPGGLVHIPYRQMTMDIVNLPC
jgi:hypothetical protein